MTTTGSIKWVKGKLCFDGWELGDPPEGHAFVPKGGYAIPEEWLQELLEGFFQGVMENLFFEPRLTAYKWNKEKCDWDEWEEGEELGYHPLDFLISFDTGDNRACEFAFNLALDLMMRMEDEPSQVRLLMAKELRQLADDIEKMKPGHSWDK